MSKDYPELNANCTYQDLMQRLGDIEGDLQDKREDYTMRRLSLTIHKFPAF